MRRNWWTHSKKFHRTLFLWSDFRFKDSFGILNIKARKLSSSFFYFYFFSWSNYLIVWILKLPSKMQIAMEKSWLTCVLSSMSFGMSANSFWSKRFFRRDRVEFETLELSLSPVTNNDHTCRLTPHLPHLHVFWTCFFSSISCFYFFFLKLFSLSFLFFSTNKMKHILLLYNNIVYLKRQSIDINLYL